MDNNTAIFCISDIHINEKNAPIVKNKLHSAILYIKKFLEKNSQKKCITIFSGDISYSGKDSEYELMSKELSELKKLSEIVICPGNHDHDFSVYKGPVREILLKEISQSYDENFLLQVSEGMNSYREFEQKTNTQAAISENLLSKKFKINSEIFIHSLNTAWCSSLKETPNSLFFPIELLQEPEDGKLNLIFFHHPISWFQAENSKRIRNILKEKFQIIISGHEHEHDAFSIETDSSKSLFIESVSFFSQNEDTDGFVCITKHEQDIKIEKLVLLDSEYRVVDEKLKSNILREKGLKNANAELSLDFSEEVSSLGTGFTHVEKKYLEIDDIFVYPNLSIRINNKQNLKAISSKEISDANFTDKIFITGDEHAGKTTLAKRLFKDFFRLGFIPIFLSGQEVKKSSKINYNFIEKIASVQYSTIPNNDIFCSDLKRVLIVDDFDKIKGSNKSINDAMSFFEDNFEKVIILVSDSYDLSDGIISNIPKISKYEWFDMLKLGYRLRYELVNKWNGLKESCRTDQDKFIKINDNSIKTINGILGKNYIPASPFFLMTMLQSMDEGNASDINTSSYGYYYQYLITSSLGAANIKKEELDEYYTYISELSFHYFNLNTGFISLSDITKFNTKHCSTYGLTIDLEKRIDLLVAAKIINRDDDSFSFKYPYIYYFFIASYLSESIGDDFVKNIIESLVNDIHDRKSASILMFLTHHTKDRKLLESIIERSNLLFKDYSPANLDFGSRFIDDIIKELPDIKYRANQSNSHENRLKEEENKDRAVELHDTDNEDMIASSDDERTEIVDIIRDFGITIKSVELLGQLSKNYYGSLKIEQKKELLKEAIEGPLRAIESIFVVVRDNPEEALSMIENNIRTNGASYSEADINRLATENLFSLLSSISFVFIKKTASCISNKNLLTLIEQIMEEMDTNAAKLVYLAVLLDMGRFGAPEVIGRVIRSMEKNSISSLITRVLVRNYLYMFEVPEYKVQSLCKAAGLRYESISNDLRLEKKASKAS